MAITPFEAELYRRVAWYSYIKESFYALKEVFLPQLIDPCGHIPLPRIEIDWEAITRMESPSLRHPSPTVLGSYFHYMYGLAPLMNKITALLIRESRSRTIFDSERLAIGEKLVAWFSELPEHARFPDTFTSRWDSSNSHRSCYFLRVVFHGCQILLHRPRMQATLVCDRQQQPATFRQNQCLSTRHCITSSQIITDLTRIAFRSNPLNLYMDSFASFCRYQAGLVSKDLIRLHSDLTLVDKLRYNLADLMQIFERERGYSEFARGLLKKLKSDKAN